MGRYTDKNYTDEEIATLLYNARDKQDFVSNFGYKDSRTAKKICERHGLNIEDLGKNNEHKLGRLLNNGDVFEKLTVINANCSRIGKKNEIASLCQCECGQQILVKNDFLKRGHTQSCGCSCGRDQRNRIKKGDIFGYLEVLRPNIFLDNHGDQNSECRCKCGKIITVKNNSLRRGQLSCGCIQSKGEYKINKILIDNNINFKSQYTFSDLKGDFCHLRFDYAIFNKENELLALIEYQGSQHYDIENRLFTGNTLRYDKLKREYCKKNNIRLIEIPYTEYDNLDKDYLFGLINYDE